MITLIEALNYRCLRYVHQPLEAFHVLVGPNASGKTTFFDIIAFLGRLVSQGLDAAVKERVHDFKDLIWGRDHRKGAGFELAVEAKIPAEINKLIEKGKYDTIRYEVSAKIAPSEGDGLEFTEKVILKSTDPPGSRSREEKDREIFPAAPAEIPRTILSTGENWSNQMLIIERMENGAARVNPEIPGETGPDKPDLDKQQSALGVFVKSKAHLPATSWLKEFLMKGIQPVILDSLKMREPSPRSSQGHELAFNTDGSNLPWIVDTLREKHEEKFQDWIGHLQTELEDLSDIQTEKNPENGECHIVLSYQNGLKVPSWTVSDGTLRLLALTILAYIPGLTGIYLVEEPENGIHPSGIETIYRSLSSVYEAQILLASHCPLIVSLVEPEKILCFAKTSSGETDILRGSYHPKLKNWKGGVDLGTLFAAGVLK